LCDYVLFGSVEAFQEVCRHYQLEDGNTNPEINLAGMVPVSMHEPVSLLNAAASQFFTLMAATALGP
jgi:hypothetical protein